jgi:hypothetical protein
VDDVIDMAMNARFLADAEQEAEEDRTTFAAEQEVAAAEDSDDDIEPVEMS